MAVAAWIALLARQDRHAKYSSKLRWRVLEFPSRIAASTDDPYMDVERAGDLAHDWGARLDMLGARGHTNVSSGFGPWLEGEQLLGELLREIAR